MKILGWVILALLVSFVWFVATGGRGPLAWTGAYKLFQPFFKPTAPQPTTRLRTVGL